MPSKKKSKDNKIRNIYKNNKKRMRDNNYCSKFNNFNNLEDNKFKFLKNKL